MRHQGCANVIGPWNRMMIDERRRGENLAGAPAHAIRARNDMLQMERRSADPADAQLERQDIAEHRGSGKVAGQMHRGRPDLPDHDQFRPWKTDSRPKIFDDAVEDVQVGREVRDARGIAIPEPQLAIERERRHQIATTGCLMTPTPSTPASTTSPGHSHSWGVLPAPTPSGVPVAMMSPGSSVMPDEMSAIRTGISKIMYLVLESCFMTPFFVSQSRRSCGSGISSAVTMHGPNGA